MPPIFPIAALGDMTFMAYGLKLPCSALWQQPSGDPAGKHYGECMSAGDKVAIPKTQPVQFSPQNPNKYHQDSCDTIGQAFIDFRSKVIDAVQYAQTMWKLQAKFSGLKVNAVTALGTPGCLGGPSLEDDIKGAPSTSSMSGNMAAYRDAVASGVSQCFSAWQKAVTVPGMPYYPAFAAFPGPTAPPMPNVPIPLVAKLSASLAILTTAIPIQMACVGALDGGLTSNDPDSQHSALMMSISVPLSLSFLLWLPLQMITLVMGKGPIPTFAPPFVPVGPVVAGDNIGIPGHVIA
jgi:hypothetical protein